MRMDEETPGPQKSAVPEARLNFSDERIYRITTPAGRL